MKNITIITVCPLDRVAKSNLDYFSSFCFPIGSIISIPYGKRSIFGVVIETKDISSSKSLLKSKTFSLKKITKQNPISYIPQTFIDASREVAHKHACSIGACLESTLPAIFLKPSKTPFLTFHTKKELKDIIGSHTFALQDEFVQRIQAIKSIIREGHARNEPVFIISPSVRHLDLISKQIQNEKHTVVTSSISKKKLLSICDSLQNNERITILTTPAFLILTSVVRSTVVLEHEGSSHYKAQKIPFIDFRIVAESIQRATGGIIIRSDLLLDSSTYYQYKEGIIKERSTINMSVEHRSAIRLIDMNESTYTTFRSHDYTNVISKEVEELIEYTIQHNKTLLLYTLRNGFTPILLCSDCGERIIKSTYYDTIQNYKRGIFESKHLESDEAEKSIDTCHSCGSWRLKPNAIAIEKVYELLQPKYGDHIIMSHSGIDYKHQQIVLKEFEEKKKHILLTTESLLGSMQKKVDNTAIISLDSLLSIPDIGILEKTTRLIVRLKELTRDSLVIQTRNPQSHILSHISSGTLLPLIRQELSERKLLGYPPFVHIAKITLLESAKDTLSIISMIRILFKDIKKDMYPSFIHYSKARSIVILLKTSDYNEWESILNRLKQLPYGTRIDTSPVSLL